MGQGLVGRRQEVARFRAAIDGLTRGGSDPTVISGEPGIGKTRLLAELCHLADETGHLVLWGRAAQLERDIPFAVFVDALDGYLGAQNPRRLTALGEERLIELARIFPSLADLAEPGEGALQSERFRAHRAVAALLELLSRRTPVVLALDDLQWADEASLELASHLLRRPPAGRLLLALAYRPGETPVRLSAALDEARREDRVESIELDPLSEAEAVELLPGQLGADARELLYRESGGNPFYLSQLQRSLMTGGTAFTAEMPVGPNDDVPPAVAAALAREVAELGPAARGMLEGAAVAGDPFSLDLAAAAAEASDPESRVALDELLERDLIQPTEEPRRFRFRHPIVHRSIYLATKPGWRLGAHARVRDALERLGAAVTELAHHVEQASTRGDERAISILGRAGQAAEPLAPAVAAHWFGAAISRLPERETGPRVELLVSMAEALAACGQLERSRAALVEALELVPEEAESERAGLVAFLASLDHTLGNHQEVGERLRSALGALPDQTSLAAGALQFELAVNALYTGQWDRMRDWASRAARGAAGSGEGSLTALVETLLAYGHSDTQLTQEAERHLGRAEALVDSLGDGELIERLDVFLYLGFCEYFFERYEDGARHLHRAVTIARSHKQGQIISQLKAGEAWCLIHLGRTREAIELAEEAFEAARLVGHPEVLTWGLAVRCWVSTLLGELDAAVRFGGETVAASKEGDMNINRATAHAHLGLAYVEAGENERCIEEFRLAGAPEFARFLAERKPFWCEALSRATLALDREAEAEAWAAQAEGLADGLGLPVALAAAQRSRARLLLARDDAEGAAAVAAAAVEGLESRKARLEAGRTRVLAAQALAAAGRPAEATVYLERAHAELDACGAARYRDEAARELRLLGRSIPRVGRRGDGESGVGALSGREREIAELVAQAKTNREIAASLYISEKTVEKHLTRVFVKLEVPGRAAVGAKLAGGGAEAESGLPHKK